MKVGEKGVDFLIENKKIYLQLLDLDTILQSIKILKQDLGELNKNLLIGLVLLIDGEAKVLYIIPSTVFIHPDESIFNDNEISLMPSLSNWEISIYTNAIPELSKYALENMIDKL
mgnify:CR=1 FL=1|tara:strand:+ start:1931 stop:2275 length:345 start_codon:yes stop_codon:yes gene_type:complete